ncbi:MAG: c-type cytochrome [Desulfuromonadales bacterium]
MSIIFLLFWPVLPASSEERNDGAARKLINAQGCKACHALESDGGIVAESFEEIRAKRSRAEIRLMLVNPEGKHGKSKIPDFSHLSDEETGALVNFIQPDP